MDEAGRPGAVTAGGTRPRVAGVVPWGVAAGAVAWCLAGCARSARMDDYPWTAWTPIGYGAVKGVFLGLLAGWSAVLGVRVVRGTGSALPRAAGLFAGGLLGGLVPGSLRDFLGPPQPRTLYYFDGPRPASEWYWRPLLSEWLVHTVLPALGCAVVLTVCAVLWSRSARREDARWAVTAPVGLGLLLLPHYAAAGFPHPRGTATTSTSRPRRG